MRFPLILVCLVLAGLALTACAATTAAPQPYPGHPASPVRAESPGVPAASADAGRVPAAALLAADAAAEAAEGLLGAPYRSGGAGPEGFDCSGLVQYVFARAGVALPRSVREQWRTGAPVDGGDIRRGDLLFFAIGGREVSHVGIAIDADAFVHAPSSRGVVRVERSSGEYWARRYAGARRIE